MIKCPSVEQLMPLFAKGFTIILENRFVSVERNTDHRTRIGC